MELTVILHWLGVMLMVAGAGFIFVGSLGIWRMPEFFMRLHPAGISDSLGMPLVLAGVMLQGHYGVVSLKILLLTAFAMITCATATHALASAALLAGEKPSGEVRKNGKSRKQAAKVKAVQKKKA